LNDYKPISESTVNKLLPFTLFFVICIITVYPQWTNQNPVPDGNDLWSTFFIDDSTGWIVGSDGFIKKTTNAGIDWALQNSSTTSILKSVQFVNQNIGWICGESGLILKTTDGGLNWFPLTSGTTEHLTDIHFLDTSTGFAVGFSGTILKTTDGGSSWVSQHSGTSSNIYDIDFVDALVGYAVGGKYGAYTILKTTDGGSSWVDKHSGFYYNYLFLLAVKFIDAYTGFIGGGYSYQNVIYKTTDGGETWVELIISTNLEKRNPTSNEQTTIYNSGGINSIYFKDSNIGYAVGGNGYGWDRKIYTTIDGGNTWTRKYIGWEENGLISVYGNSQGQGLAVGFNGTIFITEDDGNSWAQILSGNKYSCWSGDDLYSVFCINENIGWAVGSRASCLGGAGNIVLKTTNGGKIWKTQLIDQQEGGYIRSVYFINEYFGWAVGEGIPGFYRTTDGGENWTEVSGLFSPSSVIFMDQNTGWATKDNYDSGIYKSTDGGITWVQKSSISSSSIYFSDINTGWAVGEGGSVLKSTDGGETWIIKMSGTTNDLNCVKFFNANLGMCVGNGGIVLLSTDGGESWITQNSGAINDLKAITFTNSSSIWIAGSNGTILNSTDLGTNWTSYNGVTENDLTSLCFANENTGWIGGMNGTMFKYQNNVVPVELISFTAQVENNTVQLKWQTATEINNYGFEIERTSPNPSPYQGEGIPISRDGRGWEKIGLIPGFGTTNEPKSYSFIDKNFTSGIYKYRLKQIDFDGKYKYSNEIEVEIMPTKFAVYQNYPNPFNPTTIIRYQLPKETKVVIKIYDILGAEIMTLLNEKKGPGIFEVVFNSRSLPSGTYIYRIIAGDFVETKKMILIK
jgi:photosystem II stability/assembly factor-like uncharacterized protein